MNVVFLKNRRPSASADLRGDTVPARLPLRILLVEDDTVDAKLFFWCARRIGIDAEQITVARTIGEATALLERDSFDLHVVDFWIGAENSSDLIETLVGKPNKPPILVLSNLSPEEMIEVYRPSDQLGILCKGQLGAETLGEAIGFLVRSPEGKRAEDRPEFAVIGVRQIMDTLKSVRSVADRVDGFVTVAEAELSAGNADDAHHFVISAASQVTELRSKIESLEKLVKFRFQGDD